MDTLDSTTLKRCSKCREEKPRDQFHKNKTASDGLHNQCKTCRSTYRAEHKEELREYKQRYRAENREAILESKRQYYAANAERLGERQREYNAINAERIAARKREYYLAHIDHVREYRAKNADRIREQGRTYRAANAERVREYKRTVRQSPDGKAAHRAESHNRRARAMATGGKHTAADINRARLAQIDKRGRLICWWCAQPIDGEYHVDHRVPIARGGSNDPGNLVISCPTCNLRKHDKLPQEWNGRLL